MNHLINDNSVFRAGIASGSTKIGVRKIAVVSSGIFDDLIIFIV